jgi:hypothetical protein
MKSTRPQEWSDPELNRLRDMLRRKIDVRQIAISLGRHLGSVKKKMRELGFVPQKENPAALSAS